MTREELERGFRRATCCFEGAAGRWQERARTGLSDEDLARALEYELGTLGGSSSETGWIEMQGAGLKIWFTVRGVISRHHDPPTWQGAATMRMAREVYGINDPDDKQPSLF